MAAAGFSAEAIAGELGVRAGTVGGYLRAQMCGCGRNWVVKTRRCGQCAREQAALALAPRWDRASVIEARRWAELEGSAPRSEQWLAGRHARGRWAREYPGWPSNATVVGLFGSWNQALQAAGLPIKPYSYTDEAILRALRADTELLGRAPVREEWLHRPLDLPGLGAVQEHFGSWNAALRAAELEVNKEHGKWTREVVIAEIGVDMSVFPTAGHLASWAGQCPGNDQSADKRRSGKTRKGRKHLNAALTDAAMAALRTNDSYLQALYRRKKPQLGHGRALGAV
ncbi:MAG: transposase, partial [Solirubrobacteraceae bacterium]